MVTVRLTVAQHRLMKSALRWYMHDMRGIAEAGPIDSAAGDEAREADALLRHLEEARPLVVGGY